MLNAVGDLLAKDHPDALLGMKGTTPLPRLSQGFRDRLLTVDPELKDESYAGESYDAVVISALAAQLAKTTDPRAIAAQINGVTTGGRSATPRRLPGPGRGRQGIAVPGHLTRPGWLHRRRRAVGQHLRHPALRRRTTTWTRARPSTCRPATRPRPRPSAHRAAGPPANGPAAGPLKIGALLPHTGDLASAGPPMFAGAQLAIREINAAGGVLGKPVQLVDGDDFTDPDKAKATAHPLINDEASRSSSAPGASSITKAVLPTVSPPASCSSRPATPPPS